MIFAEKTRTCGGRLPTRSRSSPGSRYAHSCGPSLQQPRVQLRGIGQYAKALEVNLKANEIHRSLPNPSTSVVLSYCALSETCLALNQVAEAKEYARTALKIGRGRKNYEREAINAPSPSSRASGMHEEDWGNSRIHPFTLRLRARAAGHPPPQSSGGSGNRAWEKV